MRRVIITLLSATLVVLSSCGLALAQVAPGFPPFSSSSGGPFETIDNANLNVHLSIPVLSKPGRGMPFSYALNYDSSVWSPINPSGGYVWTFLGGWTPQSQAEMGRYEVTELQLLCPGEKTSCITNGNCIYENQYSNWKYLDRWGTEHDFPTSLTVNNSSIACPHASGNWSAIGTSTDELYTMSVDATPEVTTAQDIDGHTFNMLAGTITDSNGNQISGGTDTLGMTALSITSTGSLSNPPITTTYTYTAASGQPAAVVTEVEPYTVQTNFGCSGVYEYGPTIQGLVSEIDLPDTTKYTFTYETTPGYPSNVTGRLAKVTLPGGGYIQYSYSGGSNGITCSDGSTATLTRTVYDHEGNSPAWTYAHTESGSTWTTHITAPADP